jgi:muconate cycloisomerase
MKVKVGIQPDADIARVAAVRNAIGSAIKLGVDANGGWSYAEALSTIKRLKDANIYFAEQPIPPEDVAALADLRRQIHVPVVADESIYTLQDAKTLWRLGAADVFSIYVGKAGGIGPAKAIADFAHEHGLKCIIGSNLELGVGSAAMVHLGLAARGIVPEEYPCDIIGPFYYESDIVTEPLPIVPGSAQATTRPGLGVELNDELVEKYRVE